jgi:hypothetical protein
MLKTVAVLTIYNGSTLCRQAREGIGKWVTIQVGRLVENPSYFKTKKWRDQFWSDSETKSAVMTIYDVKKMTPKGRKNVARWFERQVKFYLENYQEASTTFMMRYLFDDETQMILAEEAKKSRKKG